MFGFVHLSSLTEKGKDKLNLIKREHTCVPGVCMHMCAHAHTHTHRLKRKSLLSRQGVAAVCDAPRSQAGTEVC